MALAEAWMGTEMREAPTFKHGFDLPDPSKYIQIGVHDEDGSIIDTRPARINKHVTEGLEYENESFDGPDPSKYIQAGVHNAYGSIISPNIVANGNVCYDLESDDESFDQSNNSKSIQEDLHDAEDLSAIVNNNVSAVGGDLETPRVGAVKVVCYTDGACTSNGRAFKIK